MSSAGRVTWQRGFFRLWIVLAALWVLGTSLAIQPWKLPAEHSEAREKLAKVPEVLSKMDADIKAGGRTMDDGTFVDSERLTQLRVTVEDRKAELESAIAAFPAKVTQSALVIIGVPLVILFFGASIGWALSGFRRKPSDIG